MPQEDPFKSKDRPPADSCKADSGPLWPKMVTSQVEVALACIGVALFGSFSTCNPKVYKYPPLFEISFYFYYIEIEIPILFQNEPMPVQTRSS